MRFRPRFSLKTILLTVTFVCIGLAGWKIYGDRQRQRQLCNQLVDNVLLSKHWIAHESALLSPFIAVWANESISQSGYVSSVLHRDGTFDGSKAADKFEKQILSEWLSVPGSAAPAMPETAESASLLNRSFVFYKAIRAEKTCIQCHSTIQRSKTGIGDLIGIVKIEVTN